MEPMEIMKKCKIWAVVGATVDKEKYGYKIYKKLKDMDYSVYPVNPKYDDIDGDKVFDTISDLPVKPDIVNFVVNPRIGMGIVEECIKLDIEQIWLQPGTVSDELLNKANENNIEVTEACVLVAANYL